MYDEGWDILQMLQGNDVEVTFEVTDPDTGEPFDLTGCTVTFWRKDNRFVPDTDSSAISYQAEIGEDPTSGTVTVAVPGTDNETPSTTWARIDVVKSGQRRTAQVWQLQVLAV